MKALCAVGFVLSLFTIPAQAQNCSGTIIKPSTMSAQTIAQTVATEPTDEAIASSTSPAQIVVTETLVEAADHVGAADDVGAGDHVGTGDHDMIVSPNAAQETSVEAIAPGNATQVAEHATKSDSKLMAIAPSTPPAQIVVTDRQ